MEWNEMEWDTRDALGRAARAVSNGMESNRIESNRIESNRIESNRIEWDTKGARAVSNGMESNRIESNRIELNGIQEALRDEPCALGVESSRSPQRLFSPLARSPSARTAFGCCALRFSRTDGAAKKSMEEGRRANPSSASDSAVNHSERA